MEKKQLLFVAITDDAAIASVWLEPVPSVVGAVNHE